MLKPLGMALALVTAFTLAATAVEASAQESSEAAFFKGKTVRFLVGVAAGGGYDAYARMLAPHLAKVLDATVIVENQPGAGGLTALGRLATAPPDGLTIKIVNGTGAALAQLVGQPGVRYDLAELGHLGTISGSPGVWLVKPNSPFKTVGDAIAADAKINFGAGGPMDVLSDGAAFTCEALKLKCQIVLGYKGSADAALAMSRGEMDAIYVSDTSANNYVKAGQGSALVSVARARSRFFPDVPTVYEAVPVTDVSKWLLDYRSTLEDLGRIVVTPPALPPARLAFLQEAWKKVLTDKAVIEEGERTQRYIEFVDAEKTKAEVVAVVKTVSPEQRELVKKILAPTN